MPRHRVARTTAAIAAIGGFVLTGCGGGEDEGASTGASAEEGSASSTDDAGEPTGADDEDAGSADEGDAGQQHPDVVDVVAAQADDGTWSFDVTLSSPYDTPERYADAWRVLGPDGTELGVRELTHDHANEQPFTRSLDGVEVPDDIDEVTVEGRDQANGWGGGTVTISLDRG